SRPVARHAAAGPHPRSRALGRRPGRGSGGHDGRRLVRCTGRRGHGRGVGSGPAQLGAGRRQRLAEAAALPLAADLLAVTLRGGVPVDRATLAVAEALPGPLGDRLARVGRALSLGGTPAEAWAELAAVPGAERLILAAVHSAEHG